jgi:hypothetical protein
VHRPHGRSDPYLIIHIDLVRLTPARDIVLVDRQTDEVLLVCMTPQRPHLHDTRKSHIMACSIDTGASITAPQLNDNFASRPREFVLTDNNDVT